MRFWSMMRSSTTRRSIGSDVATSIQEIRQFGRRGLRLIVFVLNNSDYLSERLLCKDMLCPTTMSRPGTMRSFPTPWAARGGSMPA